MADDRWRRLGELFDAAVDLSETNRRTFLDRLDAHSPTLRREVSRLLDNDRRAAGFLRDPLLQLDAEPAEPARVGDLIGPYRLVRLLGRGGMGSVYLARRDDQHYEQQVAIKLVDPGLDSAELLRRLRSERQILARLAHPNIARPLDGGSTAKGRPFLVMEYIEGEPITNYCDRHQLDVDGRLRLFLQICSAVQHAHQNLLVHRDLKPANILVTADGTPKLLDFGIAKIVASRQSRSPADWTRTGLRPMTLRYASPEQVHDVAITTTSDVYALGVLLYELLAGRGPYDLDANSSAHELARAICEDEPRRPSQLVALAAGRYADMADVEEPASARIVAPAAAW